MGKRKKKAKRKVPVAASGSLHDAVDEIIAAWRIERPDLDVTCVGVVLRVARLSARFARELERTCERHGLTSADFEALGVLRRAGKPYRLSQTRLTRELSLAPGTVSVRISRLVDDDLVVRLPDPTDRRGVVIALTAEGEAVFGRAVHEHLETERHLLEVLDADDQELLAGFLRRLLQPSGPPPAA